MKIQKPIRIVITGPESTGKTQLAKDLASHYNTVWIPEYAREYIENLSSEYIYQDVENIAMYQIIQYEKKREYNKFILFDTWLTITKVWFKEVFGKYPDWLDAEILNHPVDFYLICDTDIEWEYDPVRENGDRRDYLMNCYIQEIELLKIPYKIISEKGNNRVSNAIKEIDKLLT